MKSFIAGAALLLCGAAHADAMAGGWAVSAKLDLLIDGEAGKIAPRSEDGDAVTLASSAGMAPGAVQRYAAATDAAALSAAASDAAALVAAASGSPAPAAAPGGPATLAELDAQENATAAVWQRLPFSTRHAMFVTSKADGYGNYDARPSNVFAPGEKLLSYIEPIGYRWIAKGDRYRFGVSVDFELLTKSGKILGGQKDILTQEFLSHDRNREFFLNTTMSVDNAPDGDYVLAYTLHDLADGRTTRIEQPFKIEAASAAAR